MSKNLTILYKKAQADSEQAAKDFAADKITQDEFYRILKIEEDLLVARVQIAHRKV